MVEEMKAPLKKRYLDQITVDDGIIYVTCSDSTIWMMPLNAPDYPNPWRRLPNIPDPRLEQIAYNDDGDPF